MFKFYTSAYFFDQLILIRRFVKKRVVKIFTYSR